MSDRGPDGGIGLGGFRRYTWWSLTGTNGFFLVVVVGWRLLASGMPLWATVVGVAALTVTVVACAVLYTRRLDAVPDRSLSPAPLSVRPPVAWILVGCAGTAVVAGVLMVGHDGSLWALAPAIVVSVVATFLPRRRRWMFLAVAVVGAGALGAADALLSNTDALRGGTSLGGTGTGTDVTPDGDLARAVLFPPGLTVFAAWMTFGMLWAWDVAERLNVARHMAAELAVAEERLRFAADLHDIQGHHLQVIALKSELAARLAATDHRRAEAEMREVRRLAADALTDTRAVVQGYRQTTLDAEIANASGVLAAAGIDVRTGVATGDVPTSDRPPGDRSPGGVPTAGPSAGGPSAGDLPSADDLHQLPPGARHLLGLVVREATTNMLRHSRARRAEITCLLADGRVRLRVGNDGAAGDTGDEGNDSLRVEAGTGLRGLADRLAAAGGELDWGREDGGERFVVSASLPVLPVLPVPSTDGSAGAA